MKLNILPLLAYAALVAADSKSACAAKNHNLMIAIDDFCGKSNLVVPSAYAKKGKLGLDQHTHISISGNCKPAQWVPSKYCHAQFYDMCAHGGEHGGNKRAYGKGGCQKWNIQYSRLVWYLNAKRADTDGAL